MLGTVLTWWATQMRSWLPAGGADARDLLVAEPLPSGRLRLLRRRRGATTELGIHGSDPAGLAAVLRRSPVLLRLPPGVVLERDVSLPLAAERDLATVLDLEMDRLTPFRADAVHWTWTVLRRDPERGLVSVRLHLVPRGRTAEALATLSGAGAAATTIEAPGAGGTCRIPAGPGATRAGPWRRRAVPALTAACAVLAAAAAAVPFVAQWRRMDRVDDRIAALRPAVAEAEALRRRLSTGSTEGDAVSAERARLGEPLRVLAALTDAMPDDTFLSELTLRGGQVTVSGQSAAAARLVAVLAADPAFRNPGFSAPLTRAEPRPGATARRDLFSLRADTGPAPGVGR